MSDGSYPTQAPITDPVGPRPAGLKGFASSTGGKAALIGGAVAILLIIVVVVWFLILGPAIMGVIGNGAPVVTTTTPSGSTPSSTGSTGSPSSTSASPTAAVPDVADIDDRDVFTPRDPFDPIAAPALHVEAASTSGTTVDEALVLNDIVTEGGVRKAVLTLAGTQYTLAAGESVGTSPWKVIEVRTSSVVMLFGDDRVTLSLGQGITK